MFKDLELQEEYGILRELKRSAAGVPRTWKVEAGRQVGPEHPGACSHAEDCGMLFRAIQVTSFLFFLDSRQYFCYWISDL